MLHIRADARIALLAFALAACTPRDGSTPAAHGTSDAAALDATATATAAIVEAGNDGEPALLPWTEAIRSEKWKQAEDAIAKLPAAEQGKPEVRYARARVAMALGQHAAAVKLLDKLEDELPLMRELVAKARAKAALEAGPYDRAAEWFASRPVPSAWLTAAEAYKKAGDNARARAQCDRVIAAEKRTRSQEEKARTMRLELLQGNKESEQVVLQDARWLATYALDDKTHDTALELVPKPNPLEAAEWIARSRTLADANRIDEALRAAERAAGAKGGRTSPVEVCHARAEAYWKARTRYPEAALQYRQCAAVAGGHVAEDSFLAARAFERADRDGDAVPAYEKVIQRWPKTTWSDQAEFHIARTHALANRWKEAATAFDAYLQRYPSGKERREAERYRAIAHLMAQDHKAARRYLEILAGNTEDPMAASRFANLAALAALRDGERTHAVALWSDVARTRPLSWAALVARARLASVSAPLPLTIDPTEAGDPPASLEVELPPPVDVLHRVGLDGDAEEALRDRESLVVAKAGGRGTEALCKAYAELDRGKRRYQLAQQIPGQLLATAPGPRNRWAWECAFPRPHRSWVRQESEKVPSDLIWAVMRQESAFDPEVVSPARAVGLLQLMPETAKKLATTAGMLLQDGMLTSPPVNIALGALYLKELTTELGANVPLAVGAYNAGSEAINRWQTKAKGQQTLDIFVETIPFLETRGYVVRVMGNLARYGYMERGEAGVPQITLDLK